MKYEHRIKGEKYEDTMVVMWRLAGDSESVYLIANDHVMLSIDDEMCVDVRYSGGIPGNDPDGYPIITGYTRNDLIPKQEPVQKTEAHKLRPGTEWTVDDGSVLWWHKDYVKRDQMFFGSGITAPTWFGAPMHLLVWLPCPILQPESEA